jgi:hypothetical protein
MFVATTQNEPSTCTATAEKKKNAKREGENILQGGASPLHLEVDCIVVLGGQHHGGAAEEEAVADGCEASNLKIRGIELRQWLRCIEHSQVRIESP